MGYRRLTVRWVVHEGGSRIESHVPQPASPQGVDRC